ncbi:hypothetical protein BCR43DRAFT_551402 [Syncephalastrum racemosum]|uniref:Uncharacterized protein n=1 Tax=Syncephalastrum racemosum TaxID=13706 RepID=A0A1X2H5J5_SYNRA|nr:hypothetical protein BCR43DRAFT_551402 [Syncephalastrum racemosum]
MTCLVFDSQREFGPKKNTSAQRSARANQALNAAKSSYRKRHTRDRVLNYASAYTPFTRAIKDLIFQRILNVQWEEENVLSRTMTKRRLLTKLGLKHKEENSHEKVRRNETGRRSGRRKERLRSQSEKHWSQNALQYVPPSPQEQGSRYTPLATLSVPKMFTQPERTDPAKKKAAQEKRERGISSRRPNTPDDPYVAKPRNYKST